MTRSFRVEFAARTAFTLLELLLAMAVFAAMAAVIIPSAGALLSDRRLVRGTDQLVAEMTRLRVRAMRDGRVMVLRPAEASFVDANGASQSVAWIVSPLSSSADATQAFDQTGSQSSLMSGASQTLDATTATPVEADSRVIEMPEGVTITSVATSAVGGQSVPEAATLLINANQATTATVPNTDGEVTLSASADFPAIYFYPTGQTSNARITLAHVEAGSASVMLRGLTGDASVEVTP
ncbi:prepilin-type N-terminal cleavage/methylation domain-containing protein [Rhodopirellula halodulae]|uniref:prepilin-type N-terminal cleavage/methylation domain-containing protein n=1 Tax=Rhodopirellula halodulae TaxID=2894198 RepID=UPI001E62E892|nr:prepilin-type N-terminal cleavage/methylation domain-containing protein [Rhodopirellula sp. JC737]MCC9658216.1 prepilin-type N-terminal cleavage/methylation domain-containing protein [Rhodopirellula sp. JC737]